jgi:hypothetical protein
MEYIKDKINELQTNSKIIRDGYDNIIADFHNILRR